MDSDVEYELDLIDAYSLKPNYGEFDLSSSCSAMDESWRQTFVSAHKSMINYSFAIRPLIITPKSISSRLPLKTIHKFCNKGCAIYCNPHLSLESRHKLFYEAYITWQMPNESCLVYGTFAAQLIGNWEKDTPKDVDGILEMHEQLCNLVEKRQKTLDEIDVLLPSTAREVFCHTNFEMTLPFRSGIIIIDKEDWYNEGVLFVRTLYKQGLELWPIMASEEQGHDEVIVQEKGIRMTFVDAVDLVIEMQLDIETEEQKVLNRRVPLVNYFSRPLRARVHL